MCSRNCLEMEVPVGQGARGVEVGGGDGGWGRSSLRPVASGRMLAFALDEVGAIGGCGGGTCSST